MNVELFSCAGGMAESDATKKNDTDAIVVGPFDDKAEARKCVEYALAGLPPHDIVMQDGVAAVRGKQ